MVLPLTQLLLSWAADVAIVTTCAFVTRPTPDAFVDNDVNCSSVCYRLGACPEVLHVVLRN